MGWFLIQLKVQAAGLQEALASPSTDRPLTPTPPSHSIIGPPDNRMRKENVCEMNRERLAH